MNRRSVIKSLGTGILGINSLPSWARNWNKNDFKVSESQFSKIIEKLVDVIIPETESPGAKSIGAHLFVERMLKDCYPENTRTKFEEAIGSIAKLSEKTYSKKIELISPSEVISLLKSAEDINSISLLKNLTISAYTNSEYYLTTHSNYQMAPGFFHGCVEI